MFPVIRSLRLAARVELCEERVFERLNHAGAVFRLELKRATDKAANAKQADGERITILQARLDENSAWYREPWFVAGVSVVLTTALTMLLILVAKETVVQP